MKPTKYELIIYWSEEDEAYVAEVPELSGCMADGGSYQEALSNAELAISAWIETAGELGREIPKPKGRLRFAQYTDSNQDAWRCLETQKHSSILPQSTRLICRLRMYDPVPQLHNPKLSTYTLLAKHLFDPDTKVTSASFRTSPIHSPPWISLAFANSSSSFTNLGFYSACTFVVFKKFVINNFIDRHMVLLDCSPQRKSSMISPNTLVKVLEIDSYIYFDRYVRKIPKNQDGSLNLTGLLTQSNDIDAFRHAYVSGVFAQEYGEAAAKLAGWLNEIFSTQSQPGDENMDYWNNAVGRKLAKLHQSKEDLAKAIKSSMEGGEMILSPKDPRKYEGAEQKLQKGYVVVLDETKTGANEIFFDTVISQTLTKAEFVAAIDRGEYPQYTTRSVGTDRIPVSKKDSISENNLGQESKL